MLNEVQVNCFKASAIDKFQLKQYIKNDSNPGCLSVSNGLHVNIVRRIQICEIHLKTIFVCKPFHSVGVSTTRPKKYNYIQVSKRRQWTSVRMSEVFPPL